MLVPNEHEPGCDGLQAAVRAAALVCGLQAAVVAHGLRRRRWHRVAVSRVVGLSRFRSAHGRGRVKFLLF
jgi:hypothetical protein